MRQPLDPDRLRRVLEAFGRACRGPGTLDLTGGATALLAGWRAATIDVDVELDRALVDCASLRGALREMAPRLERFPRVDPARLSARLEQVCGTSEAGGAKAVGEPVAAKT